MPQALPSVQRIEQMMVQQEQYDPEPLQQMGQLCQQLMGIVECMRPRQQQHW